MLPLKDTSKVKSNRGLSLYRDKKKQRSFQKLLMVKLQVECAFWGMGQGKAEILIYISIDFIVDMGLWTRHHLL